MGLTAAKILQPTTAGSIGASIASVINSDDIIEGKVNRFWHGEGGGTSDTVPASAELIGSRSDKSLLAKRITLSTDLPGSPPTENDLFWIVST